MMQPPSAGHEPVVVQLTPPAVQIAAGAAPVEIQANIRNAGDTVDQYSIEIENLDPTWFTITEQSVALFPGDSAPIVLRLHPPKNSQTRAGSYKFIVRARSHADPSLVGTTKGEIVVGGYTNFQMELAPKRATGYRGRYRLLLQNGGNGEAPLELSGRDPEMNLKYRFRPTNPTVQPGSKLAVPVGVKPSGMRLVGSPTTHRFILSARPTDGDEKDAKEVQGELVHKPIWKSWKWPILLLILGLLLLAFLVFKPQINPCAREFFMFPAPGGVSSSRFYYGMLCDNFDLRLGGPAREELSAQECGAGQTGAGFTQVRAQHQEVVGGCTETEWYDPEGNAHQRTVRGRLMYIPKGSGADIYFFTDDRKVFTFIPESGTADFADTNLVEVTSEEVP